MSFQSKRFSYTLQPTLNQHLTNIFTVTLFTLFTVSSFEYCSYVHKGSPKPVFASNHTGHPLQIVHACDFKSSSEAFLRRHQTVPGTEGCKGRRLLSANLVSNLVTRGACFKISQQLPPKLTSTNSHSWSCRAHSGLPTQVP